MKFQSFRIFDIRYYYYFDKNIQYEKIFEKIFIYTRILLTSKRPRL